MIVFDHRIGNTMNERERKREKEREREKKRMSIEGKYSSCTDTKRIESIDEKHSEE
jgi:hypothetical protein